MSHAIAKGDRNMAANVQLDIVWDGPITGLAEHRISLTAFGPALNQLIAAAKRIASNAVMKAAEPSETGRLAKLAHGIDIQIQAITEGSGGVAGLLTFESPVSYQEDLFFNLPERTGLELIEAIESESNGDFRNSAVRSYMRALPQTLTRQSYTLHENGRIIKKVILGTVKLPEGMLALPYLQEVTGMVSGVGFDPGKDEVRLKTDDATNVTALASEQHVNRALELRHQKVRALVIQSEVTGTRLLTLADAESERPNYSDEIYIFEKWGRTLQELA